MQGDGGARRGDRTMLRYPGAGARCPRRRHCRRSHGSVLERRSHHNHEQARAGRASYLSATQLTGQVNPGAEAVARLFALLPRIVRESASKKLLNQGRVAS